MFIYAIEFNKVLTICKNIFSNNFVLPTNKRLYRVHDK